MPSRGTRYTAEIERLRKEGLSDAQIAEHLSIGKSIVTRNLSDSRTQQRLAKLMTTAGLHYLKQVLVGAEVGLRWIEAERLKMLEGKSDLTAENLGTLVRNQERALKMARMFLGKNFSPEQLAKAEQSSDPRMKAAADRLNLGAKDLSHVEDHTPNT